MAAGSAPMGPLWRRTLTVSLSAALVTIANCSHKVVDVVSYSGAECTGSANVTRRLPLLTGFCATLGSFLSYRASCDDSLLPTVEIFQTADCTGLSSNVSGTMCFAGKTLQSGNLGARMSCHISDATFSVNIYQHFLNLTIENSGCYYSGISSKATTYRCTSTAAAVEARWSGAACEPPAPVTYQTIATPGTLSGGDLIGCHAMGNDDGSASHGPSTGAVFAIVAVSTIVLALVFGALYKRTLYRVTVDERDLECIDDEDETQEMNPGMEAASPPYTHVESGSGQAETTIHVDNSLIDEVEANHR